MFLKQKYFCLFMYNKISLKKKKKTEKIPPKKEK